MSDFKDPAKICWWIWRPLSPPASGGAILQPMTHVLEMREREKPATADGFALSDLWLLPVLLLGQMFALFSRHLARLKAMRRSRRAPANWRDFYWDLRAAEWPIHVLLAEGARQILAGQRLDLASIPFDPEPPDSFQPSMPRSALAMHRRIEDTARFNADPEAYVRRHAERIRARICDCSRDGERDNNLKSDAPVALAIAAPLAAPVAAPVALPVAVAIRGPPRAQATAACPMPTASQAPARTRYCAQNPDPNRLFTKQTFRWRKHALDSSSQIRPKALP
jgi:hypothetical protein